MRRVPRCCAACTVSSRASSSNDAGTVSTIGCCSRRQRAPVSAPNRGSRRRAGARGGAPTPRPATAARAFVCPPGQERSRAIDRRVRQPRLGRRDLPRGNERSVVAREDCRRRRPACRSRAGASGRLARSGSASESRGTTAASAARAISPAAASCGTSKMRIGPRAPVHASAELVVPRSIPTSRLPRRGSVGVALTDVQLELPALAVRSRATHQSSSVPTSVTRLSSVTGTAAPSLAVDLQRHVERSSALRGRRPSPRSATRPDRSCGRSS